jgi:hypothetical protein
MFGVLVEEVRRGRNAKLTLEPFQRRLALFLHNWQILVTVQERLARSGMVSLLGCGSLTMSRPRPMTS